MSPRPRVPAILTAVVAAVAHLVLLVAPLTCACGPREGDGISASASSSSCCCKPGDPPMPCSSKGGGAAMPGQGGGCAASAAPCASEVPPAVAGVGTPHVLVAVLPALDEIAPVVAPAREIPSFDQDVGPPPDPIGLVLARCSTLLI